MAGASWFHVTGITPALGEKATAATAAAMAAAKRAGARVSVDLNYRKKLWSEAQAQATMRPLMREVDVVIANEEDLQSVLGVHVAGADVASGALDTAGYRAAAERVTREFGPAIVAVTLRESLSASDNGWSAVLWDRRQRHDAAEPAVRGAPGGSHRRRRQLCRPASSTRCWPAGRSTPRCDSRSPRARSSRPSPATSTACRWRKWMPWRAATPPGASGAEPSRRRHLCNALCVDADVK
jgi:hypothetical protein